MSNKRYEHDMNVGIEKRGDELKRAQKNRIGYVALFIIYVIIHIIIVLEVY